MVDYADMEEEEKEEKPKEKEIEAKYDDMVAVIKERNKITNEIETMKKDLKDRIGRINVSLFGNPEDPDWIGKLDVLSEEINHPMTRTHPIAEKFRAVVREIRELQIEYTKLHGSYERYIKLIGELLDNSIQLYEKGVKTIKGEDKEATSYVTKDMVEKFMDGFGINEINHYNGFVKDLNYKLCWQHRNVFIKQGTAFFGNVHSEPKKFSAELFDRSVEVGWEDFKILLKKKGYKIGKGVALEQIKPQTEGLTEKSSKEDA